MGSFGPLCSVPSPLGLLTGLAIQMQQQFQSVLLTSGHDRRKQARAVLDFENLPELPAGAFEVATSRDQICHKALPPAHTLLAPDCHFQVRPSAFRLTVP